MLHKITTFPQERIGTPLKDPQLCEFLTTFYGDYLKWHFYDIERNGVKTAVEARYEVPTQYAPIIKTTIFPHQQVEVSTNGVYFLDHYGNAERVSFEEMGCTFKEFMDFSPESRSKYIKKAY